MYLCPVCKKQEGLIAALREELTETKRLASYHSHHEILEGNCQTCYLQDAARELDHAGMDALNAELAKTKQEFERFAERAVLDTTKKDQAIQSMKEAFLWLRDHCDVKLGPSIEKMIAREGQ